MISAELHDCVTSRMAVHVTATPRGVQDGCKRVVVVVPDTPSYGPPPPPKPPPTNVGVTRRWHITMDTRWWHYTHIQHHYHVPTPQKQAQHMHIGLPTTTPAKQALKRLDKLPDYCHSHLLWLATAPSQELNQTHWQNLRWQLCQLWYIQQRHTATWMMPRLHVQSAYYVLHCMST